MCDPVKITLVYNLGAIDHELNCMDLLRQVMERSHDDLIGEGLTPKQIIDIEDRICEWFYYRYSREEEVKETQED